MKLCAVIPTRNHDRALPDIVAALRQRGIAVIIIDDGSATPQASTIAKLHAPGLGVEVIRFDINRGKGVAVLAGFKRASELGFSHALQIDADGQHDLGCLDALIAASRQAPEALISGQPIYDQSVPKVRQISRYLTHVWVWIETLSFRITDSMCGFRIYPLAAAMRLIGEEPIGAYMDFDTDIMVRLFWRGTAPVHVPVHVIYPPDNTSNFRLLADNWRITCMHTRLVLTMLTRLPSILSHRPPAAPPDRPAPRHWAALQENGAIIGVKTLVLIYRLLGRRICLAIMGFVVAYFYAVDRTRRMASRTYLTRVHAALGRPPPTWGDGYRHFMSFAAKSLDAFIGWCDPGRVPAMTVVGGDLIDALADKQQGALLIVSHLGNAELSRATLRKRFHRDVYALLHTEHARIYNGVIRAIQPEAMDHTIEVNDIGPDTAIKLRERIDHGDWIAIAGDRTPLSGAARTAQVPFLGANAPFSTGPYLLGAIMGCPVFLLFCLRDGNTYSVRIEKFADTIALPRGQREAALQAYAAKYAQRLEHYCLQAPEQFYNFYDFWASPGAAGQPSGAPATTAHAASQS